MHILSAVEAWWTARAHAIGTEDGDGAFFEGIGRYVVEMVLRGEIRDDFAAREFDFGTGLTEK